MFLQALRFGISTVLLILLLPWLRQFNTSNQSSGVSTNSLNGEDSESHESSSSNAFISISMGMNEKLSAYTGGSVDSTTGVIFMLERYLQKNFVKVRKTVLFWGIVLGIINFAGSGFQQW